MKNYRWIIVTYELVQLYLLNLICHFLIEISRKNDVSIEDEDGPFERFDVDF